MRHTNLYRPNEPADTQVVYGSTTSYGSATTLQSTLVTSHTVTLSNLSAGTTYNYRLKSRDAAGNLAQSNNGTITTASADTTPPTRSSGSPSESLSAGVTSTTLSLSTNESSTCKYGTSANTSYLNLPSTFSSTGNTYHSQNITGLSNGANYFYYIKCRDSAGNSNSSDYTIAFSVASPSTSPDSDNDGVPDSTDLCPQTPASLIGSINRYGCPKPKASTFDIKPDFHALDLRSTSNLEIGKSTYGTVRYLGTLSLLKDVTDVNTTYKNRIDLDSNIILEPNKITLNSQNIPELNKPATITLYNISFVNPKIMRDGQECPSTVCSNITYDKTEKTITFSVTGFSSYEVVEGYTPSSSDEVSSGGGGGSSAPSVGAGSYTTPSDIYSSSDEESGSAELSELSPDEKEISSSSCPSNITSNTSAYPSITNSLTPYQIQSILTLLLVFEADQTTVNEVHCALLGYEPTIDNQPTTENQQPAIEQPSPTYKPTSLSTYNFTEWLLLGSEGEVVR